VVIDGARVEFHLGERAVQCDARRHVAGRAGLGVLLKLAPLDARLTVGNDQLLHTRGVERAAVGARKRATPRR